MLPVMLNGTLSSIAYIVIISLISAYIASLLFKDTQFDTHPGHFKTNKDLFLYVAWLLKEIFNASVAMCKLILSTGNNVDPQIIEIQTLQNTHTGRIVYSNSINLTPGTITMEVSREHDRLMVHCVNSDTAKDLRSSSMDIRIKKIVKS